MRQQGADVSWLANVSAYGTNGNDSRAVFLSGASVTPEEIWRGKSDHDLLAASARLGEYTAAGQQAIVTELQRRRASGLFDESINAHDSSSVHSGTTSERVSVTRDNLIIGLWRGDVSLPRTYWLFGFLANLVFRAVIVFAIGAISRPALLFLLVSYLAYCLFISVAIWRSAGRYRGDAAWKHLARLSLVLTWVGAFANLFRQ